METFFPFGVYIIFPTHHCMEVEMPVQHLVNSYLRISKNESGYAISLDALPEVICKKDILIIGFRRTMENVSDFASACVNYLKTPNNTPHSLYKIICQRNDVLTAVFFECRLYSEPSKS